MKVFTSYNSLCTKREAKAPRGNQQLKIKWATADWKVGFERAQLHFIYRFLPGKVSDYWLVQRKQLPFRDHTKLLIYFQVCRLAVPCCRHEQLQLFWPLLGINCCNHSTKFEEIWGFSFCLYTLMLQLLPEDKADIRLLLLLFHIA